MINWQRRRFIQGLAAGTAVLGAAAMPEQMTDALQELLQTHYLRISPEELVAVLLRIERQVKREYGADIHCHAAPARTEVAFGFAINLSRCSGTRQCVTACRRENNCGQNDTLHHIRVLSLPRGSWNLAEADPYFAPESVPEPSQWYLPVQCQQCDEPPCVQNCPIDATWKEPDGVVVIDYNWCIGCRSCMTACPYGARHFNWRKPTLSLVEINPDTDYLSNRPRPAGVVEKCTFCLHRTRQGKQPACVEACANGARIFGNLLDANSEIRQIMANYPVYRQKEEQGSKPRLFYYLET